MPLDDVKGKKILVIGGSPRERVDTFRFYFNDARPEAHAANAARMLVEAGADVTFVVPAASKFRPEGATIIDKNENGKNIESAKDITHVCENLAGESFDAVLQLANITSVTCPAPATKKLQKTDVAGKGLMFQVAGNIDITSNLRHIFGTSTIAGYDTYQHWSAEGNPSLASALQDVSNAANNDPLKLSSPAAQVTSAAFWKRNIIFAIIHRNHHAMPVGA